jgi:hypothetical protein
MTMWRRRTLTVTTAAAALLAMSASSALAHHCYNDARSDRGNERAATSQAHMPVADFIDLIADWRGLCDGGREHMQGWASGAGVAGKLVNTKATMAAGATYLSPNGYSGKGIGYLPYSVVLEAEALCAADL